MIILIRDYSTLVTLLHQHMKIRKSSKEKLERTVQETVGKL